jgi:hypothetical protein
LTPSDRASECAQLIGDGRLRLDVGRGQWAPASEPADEIGCGTSNYGAGADIWAERELVVVSRADD